MPLLRLIRNSTLYLFFFLITANNFLYGQAPVIEWQKCLGSNDGEDANNIQPTSDGGYVVVGSAYGADNGDVMGHHGNGTVGDIWIVKLDKSGNIQWQKCLGGTDSEAGAYILQTADGGYVVAGSAASSNCNLTGNHGGFDFWVVRLNNKGDVIWQKMYGGSQEDYALSLSIASDGGYMIAGHTLSNEGDVKGNHGGMDWWIIKIDGTGNLIWQKCLGGGKYEQANSIQSTADGGCIIAGWEESTDGNVTNNHGIGDYWLVKLDKSGNIQWQKTYGGTGLDEARCVRVTNDGGYIVAGESGSYDGDVTGRHPGGDDIWILKVDNIGNIQWKKCYGGTANESGYFIQPTLDGGYVVAGSSSSVDYDLTCNSGKADAWVFKINNAGDLQWQKSLGGNNDDEVNAIQPLNDGSFIVAGNTSSSDIEGYHQLVPGMYIVEGTDYWVIKLSAPVTSIPAPVVSIDPASAIVCSKGISTIKASVLYAGLHPIYQWTKNGVSVGTNSPVYSDSGFKNNDQVICTVTGSGTLCDNTVGQGNVAISLKVSNNTISPSITISADNTFICDCLTIKFKAVVSSAGSSPLYQWLINGKSVGSNADVFLSSKLQSGDVVSCMYSDNTSCMTNGPIVSNSITISAYDGSPPVVAVTASADTVCKGSMVTFTANALNAGANPLYQWKVNGINAGGNNNIFSSTTLNSGDVVSCSLKADPFYSCFSSGRAISNSIVMTVVNTAAPTITVNTASDTICKGVTTTFTANSSYVGSNPTYQWEVNGLDVGNNSDRFTTASLSNGDVITCKVTVDPSFSCALSNFAISEKKIISVNDFVAPTVSISDPDEICAGSTLKVTATAQNVGALASYQWILNNTNVASNSPVYTNNNLLNGDQLYCLLTPGSSACSTSPIKSNTVTMAVNSLPAITVSPTDTIVKAGTQLRLNSIVSGIIGSFHWEPSDKLENSSSLTPMTTALFSNTIYTLNVVSDKGCTASKTVTVKISESLYMPNAFTPNGDGKNDVFRIPPDVSLKLEEFSIYDRWGTKIFSTENVSKGWDGTINGKQQATGVYVYIIKGTNEKGTIFLKGSFVLIR